MTFITKWRRRSCLFSNLQAEQCEKNKFKLVLGEIFKHLTLVAQCNFVTVRKRNSEPWNW